MHCPLFSVVMPAYNRSSLIVEALECVKGQTYRPIQLVVVDDGSTDDTAEVVKAWAERSREEVFSVDYVYQENSGPGAARNRGIREIKGEYVQFFDSDDLIPAERLSLLADTFLKEGCEFIQTGFDGFCADCGEVIETHHANPDVDQFVLALRGKLWPNTLRCAMTADLVKSSPLWDEEMTCFEDYKYVVGLVARAKKCVAIPEVLASARRGGGPRVSDKLKTHEGRGFRIRCEEEVAKGIALQKDIDAEEVSQFASRIYALGFRSAGSGWPDHAKRCGEIADGLGAKLDALGKRRKMVYKLGPIAAKIYEGANTLKSKIFGGWQPTEHHCPRAK